LPLATDRIACQMQLTGRGKIKTAAKRADRMLFSIFSSFGVIMWHNFYCSLVFQPGTWGVCVMCAFCALSSHDKAFFAIAGIKSHKYTYPPNAKLAVLFH